MVVLCQKMTATVTKNQNVKNHANHNVMKNQLVKNVLKEQEIVFLIAETKKEKNYIAD